MEIRLPDLGEGTESGTVLSVFVKAGETVQVDQALIELESEKSVASVPSTVAGTVTEIHVQEGDEIRTGTPIVSVDPIELDGAAEAEPDGAAEAEPDGAAKAEPDGAAKAEPDAVAKAKPDAAEIPTEQVGPKVPAAVGQKMPGGAPTASPSIRRMARQVGITLERIRGTGRGGRIVLGDLRDYIAGLERSGQPTAEEKPPKPTQTPSEPPIDFSRWGPVTADRMSSLRKTIARRMVESWTRIPHVTQSGDADITELNLLRRKYNPDYKERNARLTLTPIILKAVVDTLGRHPTLNSSLDETAGAIVTKAYHHIGLAVDTDAGLIVPVIRDVDRKSVFELALEIEELAERTRQRKVSKDEMQGGTFTVSNQGAIGGAHFTPIINLPEVAILGLGRGREVVRLRDQTPESRLMLPLTLSHDHRVVDGAAGVRFLVDLIQTLESFPESELRLD